MKKIIALLLALAMVFALVACGDKGDDNTPPSTEPSATTSDDASTPSDEGNGGDKLDTENPIKIGHLADLTGNEASTGLLGRDAVDFAAKLINEAGGIDGREVKIITKDTASSAATAADMLRVLVEEEEVVAVVGPTQIGHKKAVAEVAADYGVPVIAYNGTPAFMAQEGKYFMSSGGGTSQMPTAMAQYLYDELDCKTIYTITQEGTAGDNYVKPLIENFEKLGGKVVEDIRVPASETDTSSYLLRITEDADALVGWLSGTQGVNLWTNWYEQGLANKMPLYGAVHGGFTDYFIWKQLSATRSDVVEKALEWGVYAPINWAYSLDNDVNKDFVAAWKDEFNETAVGSNLPGAGYTALMLIKNAYESIDGEVTGENLYAALQNAQCDGTEGHTAFNGGFLAVKDVHIAQVEKLDDGSFNYKIVKTYEDVPVTGLTVG